MAGRRTRRVEALLSLAGAELDAVGHMARMREGESHSHSCRVALAGSPAWVDPSRSPDIERLQIEDRTLARAGAQAVEPLPGGRAPRRLPRSGRRWGPVAISLGLHGAALLIAVVWFAAVHQSGPVPRRLQLAAVDLADAEETEAVSTEQVSAPDLPPAELEVNIPDTLLLHDSPSEECELPECDFTSPDLEPSEFLDVPLSAAGESRPKAAAVVPPAEPRPAARRPIARPAQPASRPPSRPHRRTGRALRLVHRPNLMQYYPAEARRRGIEGEALVEIRVDTDGRVVEAVIIRSSGSALLDRQAIRLMYAYRFAAGDGGRSRVPVNFRLQ